MDNLRPDERLYLSNEDGGTDEGFDLPESIVEKDSDAVSLGYTSLGELDRLRECNVDIPFRIFFRQRLLRHMAEGSLKCDALASYICNHGPEVVLKMIPANTYHFASYMWLCILGYLVPPPDAFDLPFLPTFLLNGVVIGGWFCLLDVMSRQPGYMGVKQLLLDSPEWVWNFRHPKFFSWILASDGRHVEGFGVVNLPENTKVRCRERLRKLLPPAQ